MALVRTTVTLNANALRSLTIAAGERDLRVRANRVLNAARRLVPVDEGRLRGSLTVEFSRSGANGMPVARIGSNLPYAIFVHQGTGIYGPRHARIYPRHAPFMVWPVKNNAAGAPYRRFQAGRTAAFAFARSTRGMPGRPFLVQALDAARG